MEKTQEIGRLGIRRFAESVGREVSERGKRRIYLAAKYGRKAELQRLRPLLTQLGHEVTSGWLDNPPCHDWIDLGEQEVPVEARSFAEQDWHDIKRSDTFVVFSDQPAHVGRRGGKHVETGMALAYGLDVHVVGTRENIFHSLGQVRRHRNWTECLEWFTRVAA